MTGLFALFALGLSAHYGFGALRGSHGVLLFIAGFLYSSGSNLTAILWICAGQETIQLTPDHLSIERRIPIWARRNEYALGDLQDLAIRNLPASSRMTFSPLARAAGIIGILKGRRKIGFGLDLTTGEADTIAQSILAKRPSLAPRHA